MTTRAVVLAELQAIKDAKIAAKAGPDGAKFALAAELMLLVEDFHRQTGDQEAYAVRLAGGLLPKLVELGWIHVGAKPIDMILFCPKCGTQHVDAADEAAGWTNPPHRSHKCHACEHIWRPADLATNGVLSIETGGKADAQPPIRGVSVCARSGPR